MAGHEALTTIIHNLLSNAIKFSPEGGSIRISLSQNAKQALLDVEDEGPGVAPKDANQIFEPFFRSTASRHVAGVGLGLGVRGFLPGEHLGLATNRHVVVRGQVVVTERLVGGQRARDRHELAHLGRGRLVGRHLDGGLGDAGDVQSALVPVEQAEGAEEEQDAEDRAHERAHDALEPAGVGDLGVGVAAAEVGAREFDVVLGVDPGLIGARHERRSPCRWGGL
ncbi:MAG: sensor histidine kinase [Candidatus Sericytochromatia bacterium]